MVNKSILTGILIFFVGQVLIWYQSNSQFFNEWAKQNPLVLSLLGIPISYSFIIASRYVVEGFNGMLWPGRLIGFSSGMIIMSVLTYIHMGQGITLKTGVTLMLAFAIVGVQLLWKQVMPNKNKPLYLFDLLDQMYSELLKVDVETYSYVIENKCTFWEGRFITIALISEREDKVEKAKQIFSSYIK